MGPADAGRDDSYDNFGMRWLHPGLTRGWRGHAILFLAVLAATPLAARAQAYAPGTALPDIALTVPGLDDRGRALDCMSMAIAYEAAGQPVAGQQAVGQVILNRMRDPRFPKTVCGVVFQGSERVTGCQFTFTCDGSFRRRLADTTVITARSIAEMVMSGVAPDRVAGATHYHADYVLPYWAASGLPVARIGAHIFYRMPGDVLRAAAAANLTRAEPDVAAMQRLAGLRHWPARGVTLAQAAPLASPAIFAPWGLPVGGVSQR